MLVFPRRIRSALSAVLAAYACGGSDTQLNTTSLYQYPVVTTIRLTPALVTVQAGQSQQFEVAARWSDGATTSPAIDWSVVGAGVVDVNGIYIAPLKADSVFVIAALRVGGLADTSLVLVEDPSPSDSTALTDTTIVTDTAAVGDTTVVSDSTLVPVDSLPLPPPPPDSAGPPPLPGTTNEPTDYTTIVGRRFAALGTGSNGRGSGSLPWKTGGSEGFDDVEGRYPNLHLESDSAAPLSAPGIARFNYPAGLVLPGQSLSPGIIQTLSFTGDAYGRRLYRKIYMRTAFRVSSNFQGHPTSTNKLVFIRANRNIRCEPIIRLRGVGSGPLVLNVDLQGSPRDKRNLANSSLNPNRSPGSALASSVQRGTWYLLEAILEMGENGSANGRLRLYLNGQLTHEYHDIEFEPQAGLTNYWDTLHVAPIWGGQGGSVLQKMFLDFDEFYASGAP